MSPPYQSISNHGTSDSQKAQMFSVSNCFSGSDSITNINEDDFNPIPRINTPHFNLVASQRSGNEIIFTRLIANHFVIPLKVQ